MPTCRCGHGRHHHRQTANAVSKRRARGLRPTGRQACQAWIREQLGERKCPCRDYVAQEIKR